jgi:crossover junction endodeoxyribonuclease RuvC
VRTVYAGIDPGLTGAVAVRRRDISRKNKGVWWVFHDAPVYQDGKRARIDPGASADLLRGLQKEYPGLFVTIEKLQPMPKGKSGSIANFSQGYCYAGWVFLCAALKVPYQIVTPVAWKKNMMPGEAKEKDASRIVALRFWPDAAEDLKRKKDHGRADAMLIAEYGRRLLVAKGEA